MTYINPSVIKIYVGNGTGQKFYNFPIRKNIVKSFEAGSFIINNCKFFSIDFNHRKVRWCYDNELRREKEYMRLMGIFKPGLDIDLTI